jgi:mercuric ion transport protein
VDALGFRTTDSPELAAEALERRAAGRRRLIAVGGILGALAASSCCVLPFVLFTVGISGAWISNLTALEPYQPVFAAITLNLLGYGFYHVYRKPEVACAEGSYCAERRSGRAAKFGLWSAAVLIAIALGFPKLASLFL